MSKELALQGAFSFRKDADAAFKSYHQYGFHIEKNLVDPAYCDALVKESYNLSGAKANDFKPFMMPHRENFAYVEALRHKGIVDVIAKLVEGVPMAIQSQFFYCQPGTRGFSLHQDNFFVQAPINQFVSAWIALVDTHPNNGGLTVYPESHKEGELPVRKLNLQYDAKQDPNANNEETIVPEKYSLEHLSVSKGSVVFIHAQVVHGSNPNQTDSGRYVLLNTYIREGASFRRGNYAQRDPLPVVS